MSEAGQWPITEYHDESGGKARQEPRLRLSARVFFFGDNDFEGEGSLVDISTRGCRVSTALNVHRETLLKLSLFLPDYNWPARIDEATVRWARGMEFGVEFTSIRPAMRGRILMLMIKTRH